MYLVLMRTYLFFNRTFIYNWYDILNLFSRLGVTIGCRQFITQSLHRLLQSTCTWSAIMMNTPTGLMCQLQNQSNCFDLHFTILKLPSPFRVTTAQCKKICPERLNWPGRLAGISEGARWISKKNLDHFSSSFLS